MLSERTSKKFADFSCLDITKLSWNKRKFIVDALDILRRV